MALPSPFSGDNIMYGQHEVLIGSENGGSIPNSAFGHLPRPAATAISERSTPLNFRDLDGVPFPSHAPHLLSKAKSKRQDDYYQSMLDNNRVFKRVYMGPQATVTGVATGRSSDQPPEGAMTVETQPPQVYRGVSRHRLTQRWEASLWLEGRQLYLGGFDSQLDAAHAYDLAALACKGPDAIINFSAADYEAQLREIAGFSREEVVAYVRRRSAAFSRGKSRYRGVSGHNGRWEARIGSFGGRKNVGLLNVTSLELE